MFGIHWGIQWKDLGFHQKCWCHFIISYYGLLYIYIVFAGEILVSVSWTVVHCHSFKPFFPHSQKLSAVCRAWHSHKIWQAPSCGRGKNLWFLAMHLIISKQLWGGEHKYIKRIWAICLPKMEAIQVSGKILDQQDSENLVKVIYLPSTTVSLTEKWG